MIDPSIALNIKAPQFADPLDQQVKAMNLLAMRQQASMAPLHQAAAVQQLQAGQMENEQRQLDLQDQQRMRTVWVASGGDPDKMLPLAVRAGIGPKPLMALRESLMKMATEKAGLDEKTLANHAAKNDALNALLQPVLTETDPAKQQALWNQQMGEGVNSGVVSQQEFEQHPYPGSPDAVKQYAAGLTTDKWATTQAAMIRAKAAADQAKNSQDRFNAELPGIQSSNLTKGLQVAGQTIAGVNSQPEYDAWRQANPEAAKRLSPMFSPALKVEAQRLGMTADQQVTTDTAQKNAENNVTEAELAYRASHDADPQRRADAAAALKRLDASRLASRPSMVVNLPGMGGHAGNGQATGEEYLKTLSPAMAAQVKQIATGGDKMPPANSRTQAAIDLRNAVYQYEPQFTELLAQQRRETLKEFTATQPARAGGQLLALNTLVHHADLYLEVAQALKNGNWRPGNDLYNRVASAFGATPPTEANLVARFLAGETGKVATGGVPAEGEINGILGNMRSDGSPDQMQKAGQRLLQIAAGRMVPLKEKRDAAGLQNFVQILGPDAQGILKRRGFDPETMKPAAAGGAVHAPAGKIAVISPEGTPGFIDADKWDAAQKRGFRKQ